MKQMMRRERPSPTCCPKISSDKQVIGSLHGSRDQMSESSSCSKVALEVEESGRNVSPPRMTPEIIGSVEAQLELLRHELFLVKKQVKERNRQILKLERIINHQTSELKHNCEGSSNLMKVMDLLYGAVDVQNQQLENIRSIKERLFALERSQLVFHKPVKAERNEKKCASPQSIHLPDSGDPPVKIHCNHVCSCDCEPEVKTTQNPKTCSRSTIPSIGSKTMKEHKSTMTENNSEAPRRLDLSHCNKTLDELEKQRMINCHLNEHLMKLQEEVKTLKLKIGTFEENEIATSKSSSLFEREKQSLLEQLSILKKQNSKLQGHVSQVDRERDKAVKELDAADEKISIMGIEIQRANTEARKLECQLRTTATRCGKLEELLENSERIAESLKKQKTQLEKEVDRARNETGVIKKSFRVLRNKYKKTCNIFQVYKKKVWEANEEKVVLQSQIQEYVSRVRHIEDLLLQKEQEREFIFQQFQELTAKDNCRNSFLDMADKRESPPAVDTSQHTLSDIVYLANAGTQTTALKEDNAGKSYKVTKDFLQKLDCDAEHTDYENIKSSRQDAKRITRVRDEQLTNQLDVMGKTVNCLESRMKIIGDSLEQCRKKCISQGEKRFRQCSVESSLSTML